MSWINWDRFPWIVVDMTVGKIVNGFMDEEKACEWASRYGKEKKHIMTVLEYPAATMA